MTGPVPNAIAHAYLDDLLEPPVDTLVLGCTHYPMLRRTIQHAAGPRIQLVDSAASTAAVLAEVLAQLEPEPSPPRDARYTFLVTDAPETFSQVGSRFLGRPVAEVAWVDAGQA